jgi:hypothetical protein
VAAVERYVRLSMAGLEKGNDEYIVGLEYTPLESLSHLRSMLRGLVLEAVRTAKPSGQGERDAAVAEELHRLIVEAFPGRAHFLEIQHDDDDGWVQVFQPYGLPKTELVVPQYPPPKPTRPNAACRYCGNWAAHLAKCGCLL